MKLLKAFKYLDVRNIYKDATKEGASGNIAGKIKPLIEKKVKDAIVELKLAREKLKDIPGTNYQLGLHHLNFGNLDDAILRFKMVTFLTPENAEAHYYLGKSYIAKGDTNSAEASLQKALSLKQDFPEIKYIMEKIKSPESIDVIPANIIAEHLQWRSNPTEEENEDKAECNRALVSALLSNITDKNPNLEVLDLGCANGIRGKLLKHKEVAKRIVGVDISLKAINQLKNETFHDELIYKDVSNGQVSSYLVDNKDKFDVIMAGNIFGYNGKLNDLFAGMFNSLKSSGIIALLIDKENIETGYKLDVSKDIFLHSVEYFEEILEKTGFSIADKKEKEVGERKYSIIIAKAK